MKKIFVLFAGYIAGSVVSSIFSSKKSDELKGGLVKNDISGEDKIKIIFNNFIETHQNLLDSLKKEYLTEENKKLFNEKKQEFFHLIDEYKIEGDNIIKEMKGKGIEAIELGKQKIEKLYEQKKQEIDKLKSSTPDKINDLKTKLFSLFDEFKNKLKEK